jgi:DNA-binding GntR family transcriptional regulator
VDEAKYLGIARILEPEIRGLPEGHRVPSEHEVADRFGVARSTARAALQNLTARNVIRRVRGAGSFATRLIDYPIDARRAPSWSATMSAAGAVPRSAVLSCTAERPPRDVSAALGSDLTDECHRLVRLSYVNDHAAAWGVEWVPTALVPDLPVAMRVNDSLHQVLCNAGVTPRRAWVRASAEILEAEIAQHLEAPVASLGWFVESLNVDQGTSCPVSLTQRWIRADTVRVTFESVAPTTDGGRNGLGHSIDGGDASHAEDD